MTLQRAFILLSIFITIQLPQNARAHSALKHKTVFGKTLSYINQSRLMHFFEKQIAKLPKFFPYGNELASPEYQALGKEAQIAVGIPEENHVPIRKIPSTNVMAPYVGAVAEPEAIYVNEERLNKRPYGTRRAVLFHEAIHKKYNDMASDYLIECAMLVGLSITTHALLKTLNPGWKYKFLHVLVVAFSAVCGSGYVGSKYHNYIERRADIEGHYATNCSKCVYESAQQRRINFEKENNPLQNNGYLWVYDLEIIAQDLENEHKICTYHAQQHIDDVVLDVEIQNT